MRIAYVLWSTSVMGGLETVTPLKANELVKRGHEVLLITRRQGGKAPYANIDPAVRQLDLGVSWEEHYRISNPFVRSRKIKAEKRIFVQRLEDTLRAFDADITVFTSFSEGEIVRQLKDQSKKVLETHANRYYSLFLPKRRSFDVFGKLVDAVKKSAYRRIPPMFDAFVTLTHEDAQQWGGLKNLEVIPNPRRFDTELVADYSLHVVLTIGRLSPEKGQEDLIRIWQSVQSEFPDWKFKIVGSGPSKANLESLIQELGLSSDNIELAPATTQVIEELSKASIFVFGSINEGLPMTLLEAQALGLPIVSFACPCGPRDVITDGVDGVLVAPRDKGLFANGLRRLMTNQDLREQMGKQAKVNSPRFSLSEIMNRWEELFQRLGHE